MAEGTYEFEVMRAELLGVEPLDRTVFEAKQRERLAAEQEQIDMEQTKELDAMEEKVQSGSGKLDELHQILNKTQQKLHKFKGVCGSLTNLLRIKTDSKNNSTEALHEPTTGAGPSTAKDPDLTVNDAMNALNQIEDNEMTKTEQMRATALDLDKKMATNLDALDSLINKAERAEMTLANQNQQVKKFLR